MLKAIIIDFDGVILDGASIHSSNKKPTTTAPIATPYVIECMQQLHAEGVQLGVISSLLQTQIEFLLDALNITPYVSAVVSEQSVSQPRPAADGLLKVCEALDVSTSEAIMLVASTNGVIAGNSVSIPVIGYQTYRNKATQDLSKASLILESLEVLTYHDLQFTYAHAHHLPANIVTTKRLIVRELDVQDVPALYDLYQEPSFRSNHCVYANSLEEAYSKQEAYINHMYHFLQLGLWGVFLKDTNELIGHCGIEPTDILQDQSLRTVPTLCYGIKGSHHRQGYAKEACSAIVSHAKDVLYMEELYALIHDSNVSSKALAHSLGFVPCDVVHTYNAECKDDQVYTLYHIPLSDSH